MRVKRPLVGPRKGIEGARVAATRTIDGVRHAICDILAAACRSRVVDLGSEPS